MLSNQFTPDPAYTARYLARLQNRMAVAHPAEVAPTGIVALRAASAQTSKPGVR